MISGYQFCFYLLSALLLCNHAGGFTVENESALRIQLLTNYSKSVRPEPVTIIRLQLQVTSIATVDIKNEIFALSGWWSMVWDDNRLNWTDKYPNIPVLQFFEDDIWSPTLVVSNSVNDLSAIDQDTIPLRADRGGRVVWNPPALLRVSCPMDVTYFPFDKQSCQIEVTSFGYTIQELDIKVYSEGLNFKYYQKNGEWQIIESTKQRGEFEEDGYTYARVIFTVTLERKALFYGINIILPVVVSAALTLFVFVLPPESGEKIGYCLTILLTFMVILTLVATELPTTATSTPIIEIYIAIVLVMGGLSVIFAIIVLHLFFLPDQKRIPDWVKRSTLFSMRVCYISRIEPLEDNKVTPSPSDSTVSTSDVKARHPDAIVEGNSMKMRRKGAAVTTDPGPPPETETTVTWQMVATVFDGVCFRIYTLCLVISTVVVMVLLTSG